MLLPCPFTFLGTYKPLSPKNDLSTIFCRAVGSASGSCLCWPRVAQNSNVSWWKCTCRLLVLRLLLSSHSLQGNAHPTKTTPKKGGKNGALGGFLDSVSLTTRTPCPVWDFGACSGSRKIVVCVPLVSKRVHVHTDLVHHAAGATPKHEDGLVLVPRIHLFKFAQEVRATCAVMIPCRSDNAHQSGSTPSPA